MTQLPEKNKPVIYPKAQMQVANDVSSSRTIGIVEEIIKTIGDLEHGLKDYPIRKLIQQAETFGVYLRQQKLETNQVRKFLDAINRIKADLAEKKEFLKVETEVVLLKPKLAYAAARQKAAKPLSQVMSAAIDRVYSLEDFERLVQLIESIIAYHKAEGGK